MSKVHALVTYYLDPAAFVYNTVAGHRSAECLCLDVGHRLSTVLGAPLLRRKTETGNPNMKLILLIRLRSHCLQHTKGISTYVMHVAVDNMCE